MLKRLLVFGLGTSLIQVVIFYSFIFVVYWLAAAIAISYQRPNSDANGDYIVLFAAVLFPVMVLIQNVIAAIINNIKATYVLMAITIAAYMVGLIDSGISVAFKHGLCLAFGVVILGFKTKFDGLLIKWWLT